MNIFSALRIYAAKWSVKETRSFTSEEIAAVSSAIVVASQYGNSVCFFMKAGGQCYIPLSTDASVGTGETVDLTKAKIVTLGRQGDADIQRISI